MNRRRLNLDPERGRAMRERLLERASASRVAASRFVTIRERDGTWVPIFDGTRAKRFGDSGSALVRMPAGGTLPTHRHTEHEECLVLQGEVRLGDFRIRAGDYHLAPAGSRHTAVRSDSGALLFLRGAPIASLGAMARSVLSAWVGPKGSIEPLTVRADERMWEERRPGIEAQGLWREASWRSSLIRLHPKAALPAQAVDRAAEFLVVEGEAFFGDVLLQAGDWHLEPPGSPAEIISSDVGAVLYHCGSSLTRDPVSRGTAPLAMQRSGRHDEP